MGIPIPQTMGIPIPKTMGIPIPQTMGSPIPQTMGIPIPITEVETLADITLVHGDTQAPSPYQAID